MGLNGFSCPFSVAFQHSYILLCFFSMLLNMSEIDAVLQLQSQKMLDKMILLFLVSDVLQSLIEGTGIHCLSLWQDAANH